MSASAPSSSLKHETEIRDMARRKNEDEYIDKLTSVRLDGETDRQLKATIEVLDISQSAFVRRAIQNAIAAAGVV